MTREEYFKEFVEMRGVENPCKKCSGLGVITYGSTSTWLGGIGGQMMTSDVCNRCWGSGDEYKHWVDLRRIELRK